MCAVKRKFVASRGGHSPGHIRNAFIDGLDSWTVTDDSIADALGDIAQFELFHDVERLESLSNQERAVWLVGQLWNCTDILPYGVADNCESVTGMRCGTFSQAVRAIRPLL